MATTSFNMLDSDGSTISGRTFHCTATASITSETDTTAKIRITSVVYWKKSDSSANSYYIHSPGVLVNFKINGTAAGTDINNLGNAAKSSNNTHITPGVSWTYADGYAKFMNEVNYTVYSSEVTVTKTSSSQSIAWEAVYQPSEDMYRKGSKTYTASGTITVAAEDGKVWIYTSSGWKHATPYVYTSSGWKKAIPYIYNGGWKKVI